MGAPRWSRRTPSRWAHDQVLAWRTGSRQSQLVALTVLLCGVASCFVVSLVDYQVMPIATYFPWLLLGMLLLRFRPLVALVAAVLVAALSAAVLDGDPSGPKVAGTIALLLSSALLLFQSSRQRSGLPAALGEAVLSELRDRLQASGRVPPLPEGWTCQSAMVASHGVGYAGDFLVADLTEDGRHLELILVDVCGSGVDAGPQALQLAGALGGLIGALPPKALMATANDFLLRQRGDETFATAVHVLVDLTTGRYGIVSAGHPPALRWDAAAQQWLVDNARGTAIGIVRRPDLEATTGVLGPGDALLFYTDGVVESRTADLDSGIDWLRRVAREAVLDGVPGAARRIIRQVERGDDDRAVLILSRDG